VNIVYIGLDMGGTHVDVVLTDDKGAVLKSAKAPTDTKNMIKSVILPLSSVVTQKNAGYIKRVVLSTTISTNAVIEKKTESVGIIIEPGPGLVQPEHSILGEVAVIGGYTDHRGRRCHPVDVDAAREAARRWSVSGIRVAAAVGKFSPRNPQDESEVISAALENFDFVTPGHQISGMLNFPRRVNTAALNSGVWRLKNDFLKGVKAGLDKLGVRAPVYILKADGGTMNMETAGKLPVYTVLSGPTASILGALPECFIDGDSLIIDIGGTTTDVGLTVDGYPVFEPEGVELDGMPTLVRGLFSRSMGLGGDSRMCTEQGSIIIGPERAGQAVAFGGSDPTPTDAFVVLGLMNSGNRQAAAHAIGKFGEALGLDARQTAHKIVDVMAQMINKFALQIVDELNRRPVYTIKELLTGRMIRPKKAVLIGGPAKALKCALSGRSGWDVVVPDGYEIANALGAALAKTTTSITLVADTPRGVLTIPEEGITEKISRNFNMKSAKARALEVLKQRAQRIGAASEVLEAEVVGEQEFNVVRGFYTEGKILRLTAQIKPGLRGENEG
jgi:N-methylhydantoinase A